MLLYILFKERNMYTGTNNLYINYERAWDNCKATAKLIDSSKNVLFLERRK